MIMKRNTFSKILFRGELLKLVLPLSVDIKAKILIKWLDNNQNHWNK